MSCASCHIQSLAFTDGRARSVGSTGEVHPRGAMSLVNVAFASRLNWANPLLDKLEDQAVIPLLGDNPVEMADNVRDFIKADGDRPFFLYFATSDPHRGGGLMAGDTDAAVEDARYQPNSFGNRPDGYAGITPVTYNPADVIVPVRTRTASTTLPPEYWPAPSMLAMCSGAISRPAFPLPLNLLVPMASKVAPFSTKTPQLEESETVQ